MSNDPLQPHTVSTVTFNRPLLQCLKRYANTSHTHRLLTSHTAPRSLEDALAAEHLAEQDREVIAAVRNESLELGEKVKGEESAVAEVIFLLPNTPVMLRNPDAIRS